MSIGQPVTQHPDGQRRSTAFLAANGIAIQLCLAARQQLRQAGFQRHGKGNSNETVCHLICLLQPDHGVNWLQSEHGDSPRPVQLSGLPDVSTGQWLPGLPADSRLRCLATDASSYLGIQRSQRFNLPGPEPATGNRAVSLLHDQRPERLLHEVNLRKVKQAVSLGRQTMLPGCSIRIRETGRRGT